MRKTTAYSATAFLSLICLVSCDSSKHEHTGEWYAGQYAHWYQYTCGCYSPDIAGEHIDTNADDVCDICGYAIGEQTGKSITNLTFKTIDYYGGYTQLYLFDFENNAVKYKSYFPYEGEEPEFKVMKTFSESEENTLISKVYAYGLFDIEKYYTATDSVDDGGGWELVVSFGDKTTKKSTGSNAAPTMVFNNCAKAFYDICGYGVVASVPTEYHTPPNLSYTICSGNASHEYFPYGERGDYKWNGFSAAGNKIYQINQNSNFPNKFEAGVEYTLALHTSNYSSKYDKFHTCIVKSYDDNEALTNERTVHSGEWFTQIQIDLELNKIYVVRLEFENGDFVEYTFNTRTSG